MSGPELSTRMPLWVIFVDSICKASRQLSSCCFKPVKHDALVPLVNSSTIGQSFFSWDGGNSTRIAMFLNFLSEATFRPASSEQMETALRAASAMPFWPLTGSCSPYRRCRGD